jgi:hypothetical protein
MTSTGRTVTANVKLAAAITAAVARSTRPQQMKCSRRLLDDNNINNMRSRDDLVPSLYSPPVLPMHLPSAAELAGKRPDPEANNVHQTSRKRGGVLGVIDQMLDIHDDILSDDDDQSSLCSADSYISLSSFVDEDYDSSDDDDSDYDDDSSSDDSSFSSSSSGSSASCSCYTYMDQASSVVTFRRPQHVQPRRVRFANECFVDEVPHCNDMTQAERDSIWMSRTELASVRRDCRRRARIMEERPEQARFCTRGLHEHTYKYGDKRSKVFELLYSTVFKIQSLAIPGVDTPGTIADICCRISEESAAVAHEVGLSDEEAARPLLSDEEAARPLI